MSASTTNQFDDLKGFTGYLQKMKLFSRNARLYLLHVMGMDMIHGTWEVLFNLYLLELGFGVEFIGLRLAVQGVAGAAASLPMGWLSDRIGRKAGFIVGDGGGAILALIQIASINPIVLLVAPALSSMFGSLHHVTEAPFMAENSERSERVHLFSVAGGLRTLMAMVGSLVAGFAPLALANLFQVETVVAYRYATYLGILVWLLSLVPAVLLRPYVSQEVAQALEEDKLKPASNARGIKKLFTNVKNPKTIGKLLLINGSLALGGAFVLPLANVFFKEGVHAHEHEIGTTFAAGSLFLAIGAFLAPFISERTGKVSAVVFTRFASVPFILLIGFAPQLASPTSVLSIAGFAFIMRTTLFNMSGPVADAFTMEILHPNERATATGLQSALGRIMAAFGGFVGASFMSSHDFGIPFIGMAILYAISTGLFWVFFREAEQPDTGKIGLAPMAGD